jgi:mono/diheme cytochrome c family protein
MGVPNRHSKQGRGRGLDGSGARLALRRHPLASRREVRAEDELALETARLKTAVCLGDLIEGDPLGDARPDGASCQQPNAADFSKLEARGKAILQEKCGRCHAIEAVGESPAQQIATDARHLRPV